MNGQKHENDGLDDFLKKVLPDDLSLETESRMRKRLVAFRKTLEESEELRGAKAGRSWKSNLRLWPGWAFRKEILAFSSAAMIVAGGVMHLGGRPSVLAESVSMLSTLFSVAAGVRDAGSMECTARSYAENGSSLTYSIQWQRSPERIRLEVNWKDAVIKTLDSSEEGITVVDHVRHTQMKVEGLGQIKDPLLLPVMDLLSGDILAERLNSRWQLKGRELRGEREESFFFIDREQGTLVDLSIDLNANLPVTVQKYLPESGDGSSERKLALGARFFWSRPGSPREMPFPMAKSRGVGRGAGPGA